jgi:hypothetical protein
LRKSGLVGTGSNIMHLSDHGFHGKRTDFADFL